MNDGFFVPDMANVIQIRLQPKLRTWHAECRWWIGLLCGLLMIPAWAAISQTPLILAQPVAPNVMLTLDDSGSMMFEIMPESLSLTTEASGSLTGGAAVETCSGCWVVNMFPRPDNVYNVNGDGDYGDAQSVVVGFGSNIAVARMRSAEINTLYYNPRLTYKPWSNADGTLMANASATAAKYNPRKTLTLDLTASQSLSAAWLSDDAKSVPTNRGAVTTSSKTIYPALYYTYNGGTGCNKATLSCFSRYEIKSGTSFPFGKPDGRTDCSGTKCSYAEEIQNFANWFQYYRSRVLVARAAIGKAFSVQDKNLRVGFATINSPSSTIDGVSTAVIKNGVRTFTGSAKSNFFTALYDHKIPTSGTPLRYAQDRVGQYFSRTDDKSPWSDDPAAGSSNASECRASYHLLTTDGYWNGTAASTASGNVDNSTGPSIVRPGNSNYSYAPAAPYSDGYADTLADAAMYYWNHDLQAGLANKVASSSRDEAVWQHVVTFTVGLGVKGTLNSDTPSATLDAIQAGTQAWPQPTDSNPATKLDDLWHAAINSRGQYFSAAKPQEFADALTTALRDIASRGANNLATVSTNTNFLRQGARIYSASFLSNSWTGDLQAKSVNLSTGLIDPNPLWSAAANIPAYAARHIYTRSNGVGVEFLYANLEIAQQAVLDANALGVSGSQLVDYVRGDASKEQNAAGGTLRTRTAKLGDIVNSTIEYVKSKDFGFDFLPSSASERASYAAYQTRNRDRMGMLYVGANDGMLHAFNTEDSDSSKIGDDSGTEQFAFVPAAVIGGLKQLAAPGYAHQYFVDGALASSDAYLNGTWRTVLVGTTGAGARAIYALDVSSPKTFGAANVLWELADSNSLTADDNDLGYILGAPRIGRLQNGVWVAIFGNGYESDSGLAKLYVVNLETGAVIRKIEAPVATGLPNGLSGVELLKTANQEIEAVYAGDLQGNLWKFDLSNSDSDQWRVAYGSAGAPTPVFTAAADQPITTTPSLLLHPNGGVLIIFGTGKYYASGDPQDTDMQSVYGVWDRPGAITTVSRSSLVQQTATAQSVNVTGTTFTRFYTVSNNPITWLGTYAQFGWYLNLVETGERIITEPLIQEGRLILSSFIPASSSCSGGALSSLYVLNALTGASLAELVFDANADGSINTADHLSSDKSKLPSGVQVAGNMGFRALGQGGKQLLVTTTIDAKDMSIWSTGSSRSRRLSWRPLY